VSQRHYGKIVEYDDGPGYDGLTRLPVSRKQEGYNKKLGDKDFTDVLGPLHRYLRSSCGRSKVYRAGEEDRTRDARVGGIPLLGDQRPAGVGRICWAIPRERRKARSRPVRDV
jgi:hypothetical protein